MTDEFKAQRREIEAFLKNRKLTQALGLMCKLAEKLKSKAIVERINKLQDDYRLMLRYVIDGVDDPNREALYNGFVNRSYMLLDSLTRRHLTPDTPTLYFSMVRFEAMRPDDNVAALVKRYMKLTDETSLFNLISNEDGDDAKHSVTETEVLERRLFNRLWVTFPLVGDNYDAVERLLKSDAVPAHVKQLVMSSLLMGLLEFYDESRLSLLLDVYNNTAGDAASPLPAVALTAAVLTMLTHSNRIPGEAVRGRLDLAAAKPTWKSDLRMVYIELVKTRDTERINRKMTDELIPELMKLRPDISKHQLDISQLTDITEIEENPEWMDLLDKSGITDRMRELSEIQEEGGDVFMGTFAHLKTFSFFNEIANWFLPFHTGHSAVADKAEESTAAIADILSASPFLCDSDKYSFFLSVASVPKAQQNMMMSQLDGYNINSAELRNAALNSAASDRRNRINKYVQDLYRFFKLFSRRQEFSDPFTQRFNIFSVPALSTWFEDGETALTVAEFYFSHKYYGEALGMFRAIEQNMPPTSQLYQKTGYCLQRSGDIEGALDYYQRAELLDARSLWTLKRIASCLVIMGRYSEALDYFNRILSEQADNVTVLIDMAIAYIELHRFDDAIPVLTKVVYLDPDNKRALRALGWCRLNVRDLKNAAKCYRKLVSDNPTSGDYINMGHVSVARKDFREAINYYNLAIENQSGGSDAVIGRIEKDCKTLEAAGIDISLMPYIIDALVR